ncbi:hypothetical protein ACFLZ9_01040 [Patescibacteria group bacterium]
MQPKNKIIILFLLSSIIFVFVSCTASTQKMYSGDQLTEQEVAMIKTEYKKSSGQITWYYTLLEVDYETVNYDNNSYVEVLPGRHVLKVQLKKRFDPKLNFGVSVNLFGNETQVIEPKGSPVITAEGKIVVRVQSGKKYRLGGTDTLKVITTNDYGFERQRPTGSWSPRLELIYK